MKKPEVYCCKGCGRDTTRRGGYCVDCGGRPGQHSHRFERLDRCRPEPEAYNPIDLEDRYDDESGPDDIYDDMDPLDHARKLPSDPNHHHQIREEK